MILLKIAIGVFVVLEIGNVLILYTMPESKLANAMGYFKAWEKSKGDPFLPRICQRHYSLEKERTC